MLRPMVGELRPMDRTSRTMDRTSRAVHHGLYITGRTSRAVHHGPYLTGRTTRAVPHGPYITGRTSRAIHHGPYNTGRTSRAVTFHGRGPSRGRGIAGLTTNQRRGWEGLRAFRLLLALSYHRIYTSSHIFSSEECRHSSRIWNVGGREACSSSHILRLQPHLAFGIK
jgi:hypothetical protein